MSQGKIGQLRDEYNSSIASEFESLRGEVSGVKDQLTQLNLTLASLNLSEIRAKVTALELLTTRYDLSKMDTTIDRHDSYIKYGFGVLATLQLLLTIVFAFKEYIFGKPVGMTNLWVLPFLTSILQ